MTEQIEKTKRPASQYYWGDWWKDKALHSCSQPSRGLWHEMNCLMHEGEPYGHLTLNGKPMNPAQLSNLCRITATKCKVMLDELESAGVFSRTADGAIFSRRMVRDESLRNARATGGKEGAEHGIKGGSHGKKGGRPSKDKGGCETPLGDEVEGGFKTPLIPGSEPPPSSSSSSSATAGIQASIEALSPAEPPAPPPCPTQRLLAAFAELVPELPQPRRELWEGSVGADAMRQRWKWLLTARRGNGTRYAESVEEGIEWMRRFFENVRESELLLGQTGKSKWRADLTWLMKKENFAKVVQGNYINNKESA